MFAMHHSDKKLSTTYPHFFAERCDETTNMTKRQTEVADNIFCFSVCPFVRSSVCRHIHTTLTTNWVVVANQCLLSLPINCRKRCHAEQREASPRWLHTINAGCRWSASRWFFVTLRMTAYIVSSCRLYVMLSEVEASPRWLYAIHRHPEERSDVGIYLCE